MSPRVAGRCPMGCGQSLFLGAEGHVTCSLIGCPNPTAVDEILHERTHLHEVELEQHTFAILHPLRERIGEPASLFACDIHQRLLAMSGPPYAPGRYRVTDDLKTWTPS